MGTLVEAAVLVRHGETEWSRNGRHTGRTDLRLTDQGRQEAADLAPLLEPWTFARVAVSPLTRALDTCRLAGYGDAAEVWPELAEWDYGIFEGRTTAEIREGLPSWSIWSTGVPDGESLTAVGDRADLVAGRIADGPLPIVLFGHGHFLRVLAARWLGMPPDAARLLALETGTVSVLGSEDERPSILRWNAPSLTHTS